VADSWFEQSQALMRSWTEAQTRMWSDLTEATFKSGTAAAPAAGDWFTEWQRLTSRAAAAWSGDSGKQTRELIDRIFNSEQAFLGFVDLWMGLLRTVGPKIDAGEDWIELTKRYLGQLQADVFAGKGLWGGAEGLTVPATDAAELWRLYVAELQRLYGPWLSAWQSAGVDVFDAATGDREAGGRMFSSFLDAYEGTFGRFLTAPQVGSTRETSERVMRSFHAWVEMTRASVEFQTEITKTGFQSMESLMRELVRMGEEGGQVTSLHQVFELWVETAEKAYYELFSTESFAVMQGRFVDTMMQYRRRQGELLDEMMDSLGLPGRQEVDQVHRHVHDLRIELRYLKRETERMRADLARLHVPDEQAAPVPVAVAADTPAAPEPERKPAAAADTPAAPEAAPVPAATDTPAAPVPVAVAADTPAAPEPERKPAVPKGRGPSGRAAGSAPRQRKPKSSPAD